MKSRKSSILLCCVWIVSELKRRNTSFAFKWISFFYKFQGNTKKREQKSKIEFGNNLQLPMMMSNAHGFEFYDDSWQLIPPDYGATEYE